MQWRLFQLILMAQCSFLVCQLYEYHFIEENKTWDEARSHCREKYTDLATVPDKNYMKRLRESAQIPRKDAWIGLYSTFKKNSSWLWHWSLPGVEFNKNTSEKTFHLIGEKKTWREAQRYCREEYTDLVSGMKQLNNSELLKLIKPKGQWWIGLFRDTWRWSDGSNSSYRHWETDKWILIKSEKNWMDALDYCRKNHHDLVSITSAEEQKLVQEKAKAAETPYIWLGLRYSCPLDLWFWVNNKPVCYANYFHEDSSDECHFAVAMDSEGKC
ncbi:L-selectin-like [Embiotoca jacksoni]|uniref:L-selectin-like n=1 Tax=Embiotoca jacksoni TaxID=100190 RepID=UPI003703BBFF